MATYIASTNIKVFPAGFRDDSIENAKTAKLNTEVNMTNIRYILGKYPEYNNLLVKWDNIYYLSINGYLFTFDSLPQKKFAYIKLRSIDSSSIGNVLAPLEVSNNNSTSLDDDNGDFIGLGFDNNIPSGAIGIQIRKTAQGDELLSGLKIDVSDIITDRANNKNLTDKLETKEITATTKVDTTTLNATEVNTTNITNTNKITTKDIDISGKIQNNNISDVFVSTSSGATGKVNAAKDADNAAVTNNDINDNAIVAFQIGTGKTAYTKTVNNVAHATSADNATNVALSDAGSSDATVKIKAGNTTPVSITVNNVSHASSATNATNDSSGQNIINTYATKSQIPTISYDGTTLTITNNI